MSIILESRPSSPLPARTQRRPVGHESVPRSVVTTAIDLDVTDGCNLGCPYCFKNLDKPNSMTLETAKTAFEWLLLASKGAPQVHVNFMGGEPTLRFAINSCTVSNANTCSVAKANICSGTNTCSGGVAPLRANNCSAGESNQCTGMNPGGGHTNTCFGGAANNLCAAGGAGNAGP